MVRHFLIVDDEASDAFARLVRRHGDPVVAPSIAEAKRALAQQAFVAIILDVGLPDGNGLDFLTAIRASGGPHASVPVLVVTGRIEQRWANAAFDLDAEFVEKPVTGERVERFLLRTVPSVRLDRVTEQWREKYKLTAAERAILLHHALGGARDAIVLERRSSPRTVQKHVENMLRKTGDGTLSDAAIRLLREALEPSGSVIA